MRANLCFLAFILSPLALAQYAQDEGAALAGRGESWDYDEVDYDGEYIYTDKLDKRNEVEVTYCQPEIDIKKEDINIMKGNKPLGSTMVYRVHMKFPNAKSQAVIPKDAQRAQLAKDAFEKMETLFPGPKNKKNPSVMTAMLIDHEIFLASSIKGLSKDVSAIFNMDDQTVKTTIPEGVQTCMKECQERYIEEGGDEDKLTHYNKGACGECMALLYYFQAHPAGSSDAEAGKKLCKGAAFVTVKRYKDGVGILPPCTTPGKGDPDDVWGCHLLVDVCGATGISDNVGFEPYAIGKEISPNPEDDAMYKKSERYHTQNHPTLPAAWFKHPEEKKTEKKGESSSS